MDPEKASRLQEGITLVLSRWTALQMAVQNEWGGPHSRFKSEQLAADIFSWLTQSKEPLYADDLEDMLDEFMLSLNTEIADGSVEEIAEKLMIMHEECLEGNFKSVQVLKETNPPNGTVTCIRQGGSDDEEDDDDDESAREEDAVENQPHVNEDDMAVDEPRVNEKSNTEDGWTVVSSRRNRGKRN
ncbi:uncharacterized protein LOC127786596 [Diospyros lotus]|uniref:uncharacterized protein LOC127786596 n=1 Tax=Diospyros lotus TaxID=55363 RepID=UPI00224D80C6|nr:uncharacterized protein LOC127786596 [Diospyros lotus]